MHATVKTPRLVSLPAPRANPPSPQQSWFPDKWHHAQPSINFIIWMVRLSAIINLIAFSQPHAPKFVCWLSGWAPFEISQGRPIRMLLSASLLFVLSSGLARGKRVAWLLTIGTLALAPLMHLGRTDIWPQILLNLPLMGMLGVHHRYFVAKSDRRALLSAFILSSVFLIGLVAVGTFRLHALRFETSGPDSWLGCFQAACELVLVHHTQTQQATTQQALDLFHSLRIGGTTTGLLALFLILRPASMPRLADKEQRERMSRLVQHYGRDPLNCYVLLEDKNFFFSDSGVGISYVMSGRFAVVLADPVGPMEKRREAIGEFAKHCRGQDWVPLFYQIYDDSLPVYDSLGFSCLKIGEDARIDTDAFDLKGGQFQNLRTLCHKAQKGGFVFRWYEASAGIDAALEEQLAIVSYRWLDRKNGNEMTFDMGSFSRREIRLHGVGVALDSQGMAVAFVTWRQFNEGEGRVLDLMRSLPGSRNVLDFILVESINHFRAQGIRTVSLGNAPLANASQEFSPTGVEDRAVRFIYENLNHVYAYKPLFEFKRKYRPKWRSRYLAYPTGESLPLIGLALVRVHTRQGPWKFLAG